MEVDPSGIFSTSTNTLIALGAAATVVIAVLTFVWRQMKNSVISDVNKKIDASDKALSERMTKQEITLNYLVKGHDSIQKSIIKMENSLENIGHSLMKHMIDAAKTDGETKAKIAAQDAIIKEQSDDIKEFMRRFLK